MDSEVTSGTAPTAVAEVVDGPPHVLASLERAATYGLAAPFVSSRTTVKSPFGMTWPT